MPYLGLFRSNRSIRKRQARSPETFVTTFRIRVRDMKEELNARTTRVKKLYNDMKEARVGKVKLYELAKQNSSAFMEDNSVIDYVKFTDTYTEKDYSTTLPYLRYRYFASRSDMDTVKAAIKIEFEKYESDLADFATRAIANHLKVVDQWSDIVHEVELLLLPPAPKVPPTVDISLLSPQRAGHAQTMSQHYQATEKDKTHQYLKDARWISYAYPVGTNEDGDSVPSS